MKCMYLHYVLLSYLRTDVLQIHTVTVVVKLIALCYMSASCCIEVSFVYFKYTVNNATTIFIKRHLKYVFNWKCNFNTLKCH
jgi:hypothetical protein